MLVSVRDIRKESESGYGPPVEFPRKIVKPRRFIPKNVITFHHPLNRIDNDEEWLDSGPHKSAEKQLVDSYHKEIIDSQGFDITVNPKPYLDTMIVPYNIDESPKTMKDMIDMATTAIQEYNQENRKINYEVLEIEKANIERLSRAVYYYISFKAKDRKRPAVVRTFQTQVLDQIPSTDTEKQVILVRLKPIDEKVTSVSVEEH